MSKLLSLVALTALAQEAFKNHPDINKVFGTADGNIFLPDAHNAARNHARETKLEVHQISRTGATSDDILDHIETDAEANEVKRQAKAADAAASAASLPTVPATGEAVPVEAAAAAKTAGVTKAVEKSTKAIDAPAKEKAPAKPKATAAKAKPAPKATAAKATATVTAADAEPTAGTTEPEGAAVNS